MTLVSVAAGSSTIRPNMEAPQVIIPPLSHSPRGGTPPGGFLPFTQKVPYFLSLSHSGLEYDFDVSSLFIYLSVSVFLSGSL